MKRAIRVTSAFALLGFIFLTQPKASAQPVDSSLAYFPMHVGDIWEYYGYMILTTPYYSLHVEITGDTIATNGLTYKIFEERNSYTGTTTYWKRLDSLSGSIYKRAPADTTEIQEDSLRAQSGDMFNKYSFFKRCSGMRLDTVFGIPTPIKSFGSNPYSPSYSLAFGIGLVYWYLDDGQSLGAEIRRIVYAKVGGVVFGTPLSVSHKEAIPTKYVLSQNYPNPFNPSTTIEYFLPKRSSVKLSIINTIGQNVSEWTFSDKLPGRYSVMWIPQSSSGVYFYRLQTVSKTQPVERYTETRKMLLLK